MKCSMFILILSLWASTVFAGEYRFAKNWTRQDSYRQATLTALICIDWLQTHEIVKDPDNRTEANPFLGDHPSMAKANLFILGGIVLSWIVAGALPEGYRSGFQYVIIGAECSAIINNHNAGIRIRF